MKLQFGRPKRGGHAFYLIVPSAMRCITIATGSELAVQCAE